MALTETNTPFKTGVGSGTLTSGDVPLGGLFMMLNAQGEFASLVTSSDGTNLLHLKLLSAATQALIDAKLGATDDAVNALKLNGKTEAEIATSIVDGITNGAGTAYDTLLELENEIKSNDTDLVTILATQANKVDKVADSSLVQDEEITKLSGMIPRTNVRATGVTNTDLPNETAVREAIDLAIETSVGDINTALASILGREI